MASRTSGRTQSKQAKYAPCTQAMLRDAIWWPFLSSTVPSASIAWIGISPRDPRRVPGCVAAGGDEESQDRVESASRGCRGPTPRLRSTPAGAATIGRSTDARIVTREPDVDANEDALVGRVFHTGGNYVYEEAPFTMIPGSVMNGR